MFSLDFESFSLLLNLGIFAALAAIIWFVGTQISFYADSLSERTGIGKAFMGLLFLALATEMPEVGTTISASLAGDAELAVNNIFGGITLQTAILAIADLLLIRGALSYFTPSPALLMQAVLLVILLALTLAAVAAGELAALFGVGLWSMLLFVTYFFALYLSQRYEGQERWQPSSEPTEEESQAAISMHHAEQQASRFRDWSVRRLWLFFAAGAAVIFLAGVTLAQIGDVLAAQTGLGASFIGATLLAISTSLPELSTTIAAIRLGNSKMAFSNIFGSNSIMILLLFTSDIFYGGGPILNEVGAAAVFSAAMGIIVTGVYLIGLIERRNRTVLRMGIDSAVVLILYGLTLAVLYQLR